MAGFFDNLGLGSLFGILGSGGGTDIIPQTPALPSGGGGGGNILASILPALTIGGLGALGQNYQMQHSDQQFAQQLAFQQQQLEQQKALEQQRLQQAAAQTALQAAVANKGIVNNAYGQAQNTALTGSRNAADTLLQLGQLIQRGLLHG